MIYLKAKCDRHGVRRRGQDRRMTHLPPQSRRRVPPLSSHLTRAPSRVLPLPPRRADSSSTSPRAMGAGWAGSDRANGQRRASTLLFGRYLAPAAALVWQRHARRAQAGTQTPSPSRQARWCELETGRSVIVRSRRSGRCDRRGWDWLGRSVGWPLVRWCVDQRDDGGVGGHGPDHWIGNWRRGVNPAGRAVWLKIGKRRHSGVRDWLPREARQLKVDKDAESQFFADVAYYGKDAAIQRLKAGMADAAKYLGEKAADPTFNDQQRARVAEPDKIIANGGRGYTTSPIPWSNSEPSAEQHPGRRQRLKSVKAERTHLVKAAGRRVQEPPASINDSSGGTGQGLFQRMEQFTAQRTLGSAVFRRRHLGHRGWTRGLRKSKEADSPRHGNR